MNHNITVGTKVLIENLFSLQDVLVEVVEKYKCVDSKNGNTGKNMYLIKKLGSPHMENSVISEDEIKAVLVYVEKEEASTETETQYSYSNNGVNENKTTALKAKAKIAPKKDSLNLDPNGELYD